MSNVAYNKKNSQRWQRLITIAIFIYVTWLLLLILDNALPPPLGTKLDYSTEILDATATKHLRIYTTKDGFWRLPVDIKQLDTRFIKLLLAYEDQRFYSHFGIDILAIFRAIGQVLTSGRIVSGSSTITMQTIRLLHPRPRTILSKLIEMLQALQLEQRLNKTQILRLYLTLAPYGGNIQGITAASLFYFGKKPSFLTLDEIALLIALPQSPEARRPDRHPQRSLKARNEVLQRFVTEGLLQRQNIKYAATLPIPKQRLATPRLAPHFTDRLRSLYPNTQQLRTTIDAQLQKNIADLLARHQNAVTSGITLASLVIENSTGKVRAYFGSGSYFATNFPGQIDMVRAVRSPGSTLKPFIYGMAFDAGIAHPETLIFDRPGAVKGYDPGNFDQTYQGEIRIRDALNTSRNIPAIKVLNRIGAATFVERLKSVGIKLYLPKNILKPGLPIALGGVGMRLEDLVRLYAGLATAGVIVPKLQFLEHQEQAVLPFANANLLSATAAWYLTDILSELQPPAGFILQYRQLAFKTGTSYGLRDAWAIGFDAKHTVGVWLGCPNNSYTTNLSGLNSATPILLRIFEQLPNVGLMTILNPSPQNVRKVANTELPVTLQHFERPILPYFSKQIPKGPRIVFPPDKAMVELARNTNRLIHLEVEGGTLPFNLLVNGYPISQVHNRKAINWQPQQNGPVQLTILDAKGRSARTNFAVRMITP